jgi:EAL domain-containing protein (putative c-di-GMP-specific phosphodiesterase class I)
MATESVELNAPMSETLEPSDVYWVERQVLPERDFDLDAALHANAIEFWYQPKIDLVHKRLMGVEAFARLRGADGRMISAGELIKDASSKSIVELTERALVSALKTSVNLCEIGVDVRLAINVSVTALNRIPIADIVRKYRPQGGKCLGLTFDVSERQVLDNIESIAEISGQLRRCGFSIAVDDFGSSVLGSLGNREAWDSGLDRIFDAIASLRNVEFSELKLDRDLVRRCGTDSRRKTICKHIIDLAHSFGSVAVGVGIETQAELKTLQELRCDIGQGYLFGRPMSEERFLMLLWDRGTRARQKPQAA